MQCRSALRPHPIYLRPIFKQQQDFLWVFSFVAAGQIDQGGKAIFERSGRRSAIIEQITENRKIRCGLEDIGSHGTYFSTVPYQEFQNIAARISRREGDCWALYGAAAAPCWRR